MKQIIGTWSLVGIISTALYLPGAMAGPNNGMETIEFDFVVPEIYVECLGESLKVETFVFLNMHAFETKTTFHSVENWNWTSVWTGLQTGHVWLSKGVSPSQLNIATGQSGIMHGTNQFVSVELAKSVSENSPNFIYKGKFKITVNANGEEVVFWEPATEFSDGVRCLGPGY